MGDKWRINGRKKAGFTWVNLQGRAVDLNACGLSIDIRDSDARACRRQAAIPGFLYVEQRSVMNLWLTLWESFVQLTEFNPLRFRADES